MTASQEEGHLNDTDESHGLTPLELEAVLHELHEEGSWAADHTVEVEDDSPTVASVAEATGRSVREVWEVLQRLRREDAEVRLANAVRELEEPLYRVERPGHPPPDPLERHFRLAQGESLSPLLDEMQARAARRARRKKARPPKQEEDVRRLQRNDQRLTIAILVIAFCLIVAFAYLANR